MLTFLDNFFVFLQTTGESFLMAISCPPPSSPAPPKILYVCNRMEKYLGYSKVSVHSIQTLSLIYGAVVEERAFIIWKFVEMKATGEDGVARQSADSGRINGRAFHV